MAKDGFGFFYEKLGLSIDSLAFYYNCAESGVHVPVISGNPLLSGRIHNLPNFWTETGSGYFQSGGLNVSGYSTLRDDNWSFLMIPEKLSTRSEVLFSTMDSGLSSGIIVTFNSLNDIAITTKDSNGYLYSETFDLPLSNKNLLSFVKAGNAITCHSYDPSSLSFESSSKSFPSSCLLNNFEDLKIGYSSSSGYSPFSGFIDDIVLIRSTLNAKQLEILSSGFFRDGYEVTQVESSGFSFGSAHCNDGGYITGWNPSIVYTTVETPSAIDFDFMSTFMKSGIKYNACENIDSFYAVKLGADPILYPNQGLFFDGANGYFRSEDTWNFGDLLFFYNGLHQTKVSDYTYSSKLLLKSGSSYLAEGVIDSLGHEYNVQAFVSGDLPSGAIATTFNGNSILFLNGSVLISGLDYSINSGNFIMETNNFVSSSGDLVEVKFNDPISVYSSTGKLIETNFHDDYILCFINGLRKPISQFSRMSSVQMGFNDSSLACFSGDLIYGNEEDYFNE